MDTKSAQETARVLIEALPYIQRFAGTTVVSMSAFSNRPRSD